MGKIFINHVGRIFILFFLKFSSITASGQLINDFKPSGKPVFLLFTNVHSLINKEGMSPAFEINRLYLGYEYSFSKLISARATIDIGDPGIGDFRMTAYVKHAFLQYKDESFSARIGMIATDQFYLIEKQWNYRYILKPFQDEYGFGPSADLGAAVEYSPSDFISVDASVVNGEGYKKLQSDSVFKYSFGLTLKPAKGFVFRGYTDFMKKKILQNSFSLFAGYTSENIRMGFEYDIQKNNRMKDGNDFSGISAFATVKLADRFNAFSRYDKLWSVTHVNSDAPWNYDSDGQLFVAGIEYSPVKGIRIAPLYMGWLPANRNLLFTSRAGIYFEIRL